MNYTPPEPVARFNWNLGKFEWLVTFKFADHHMKPLYTESQLRAEVERVRRETVEECAVAATDAVAFNGGSVQMEAHVRQAIKELLK